MAADLVTANSRGFSPFCCGATGSVAVLTNTVFTGFDTFAPQLFSADYPFVALSVGDVNSDGKQVVVATSPTSSQPSGLSPGRLAIFRGNGNGTVQTPRYLVTGDVGRPVILVDVDRDGDLDVAMLQGFSPLAVECRCC